jgi:ATP-dependent DNA helicase RecG
MAERLARLGVTRVLDLLLHVPLRYQDRTRVSRIGDAHVGEDVVIEGVVEHTAVVAHRRRSLLCRVADGTGSVTLRFFHFNAGQRDALRRGRRLRCIGELRAVSGGVEMIHPELQFELPAADSEPRLTPVYPATEGLHQLSLRRLVSAALQRVTDGELPLEELLPEGLRERFELSGFIEALQALHGPAPGAGSDPQGLPARRRLAFEELLAHSLSMLKLRTEARAQEAPSLAAGGDLTARFLEQLPFALTDAQQRVAAEVGADLAAAQPMLRLVQGDVGSGKTVVAALAALAAVEAGYQAALMAPTELLAEQHYGNFRDWFAPLQIGVAWVSGKSSAAERRAAREAMETGTAGLAIGTHALFQTDVKFARLGLVVIDEQHRFGVHQRLALREKGTALGLRPHQLVMTATPIPRTLAMTAYADLDCSSIDELPAGRTPVQTAVLSQKRRDEIVQRIRSACESGRQAYWVCPLIEESELLEAQAAEQTADFLREALGGLSVDLVHGRLRAQDKERVMTQFKDGAIDVLVATTVVEVGVDVPNASLMIIENAERLGLAQLHQLRGRVGRGATASSCLLVYKPPLSATARARLQTLRDSNDGFFIAEKDRQRSRRRGARKRRTDSGSASRAGCAIAAPVDCRA